jgi:hypothetical protein
MHTVSEVALGERRRIERIEDLAELADAHRDRRMVARFQICGHRTQSAGRFLGDRPSLSLNGVSRSCGQTLLIGINERPRHIGPIDSVPSNKVAEPMICIKG